MNDWHTFTDEVDSLVTVTGFIGLWAPVLDFKQLRQDWSEGFNKSIALTVEELQPFFFVSVNDSLLAAILGNGLSLEVCLFFFSCKMVQLKLENVQLIWQNNLKKPQGVVKLTDIEKTSN